MVKLLFSRYFELIFWIAALTALAFTEPSGPAHFSLCPFKALGFTWCPGCGLGHSISWLFRGNISKSWHAHWFGIPALGIILYRIYTLFNQRIIHYKSYPIYR
ncbi:MAG TPA: DUF2752 domain-containing protein [Mucilaginibacter sp.]